MPLMAVWYDVLPVVVPDGRFPEVAVPLETAEEPEAEPGIVVPDGETLWGEEPELLLPVIVVPGSVVVGPGIYSVVGFVQGQSLITVGPGTTVVAPEIMIVSPPVQATELG
jgi:hypothetical protein